MKAKARFLIEAGNGHIVDVALRVDVCVAGWNFELERVVGEWAKFASIFHPTSMQKIIAQVNSVTVAHRRFQTEQQHGFAHDSVLSCAAYNARGQDPSICRLEIRFRGQVTDFLDVGIGPLRARIFNVADMAILSGALLLILNWKNSNTDRAAP